MTSVRWFHELGLADIASVGGKNANLGGAGPPPRSGITRALQTLAAICQGILAAATWAVRSARR